ncbi:MAG: NAD(P)H-dependent oxidoreductase [Treponema sp.]|nr:NAD(P)H-dependent oxidoreductase [Treponema sp.]
MQVFIIYCHPSEDSFTAEVRDSFIAGLREAGHSYVLSDLYKMQFKSDLSEEEYRREAYYRRELPLPRDVAGEQEKIRASSALVFIYPVFWTDAPAKLKGWFDRVWTYGFAYGENRGMPQLEKGLCLAIAGNSLAYFAETGLGEAMERAMIRDRFFDRVKSGELIIFEETSRELPQRDQNRARHLKRAFEAGRDL